MTRDQASGLQEHEYQFPYHHLPGREFGGLRLGRVFRGGAEYLAYTDAVVDLVADAVPDTVLDVGCGDGRLLVELVRRLPCSELHGIDTDERAVRLARVFAPEAHVAVQRVEDVEERFDLVTCVETLEHIVDDDEVAFLTAVADRVAPGGRLVVTVPSTARPVAAKHHRHYTVGQLTSVMTAAVPWLDRPTVHEVIPHRPWLDQGLRLLSNRRYSVDIGWLNERVAGLHRQPVGPGDRGLHVLAVARRPEDA